MSEGVEDEGKLHEQRGRGREMWKIWVGGKEGFNGKTQ